MFNKVKKVLFAVTVVAGLVLGGNIADHFRSKPVDPMTPERRASHLIQYYDAGSKEGSCTGTVIGPHAVLTATHCDEKRKVHDVRFDFSLRTYHIEKFLTDDNDHDIYLVDGPAFTNFVPYKARQAKVGEKVYLYGSGGGQFPPRRLDGQRIYWDDPSDVDADGDISRFSMPVIPGDSGSAVFAQDGSIVAVTTYLLHDSYAFDYLDDVSTVDFVPFFTPAQIKEALSFKPTAYVEPVKKESDTTRFNPFGFGFFK